MLTHLNLIHNQRILARALDSRADDIGVSWLPLYHDMGLIGSILLSVYVGYFCVLMPPLSFMQKPIRWLKTIHRYRASISVAPCFAYDLCARRTLRNATRIWIFPVGEPRFAAAKLFGHGCLKNSRKHSARLALILRRYCPHMVWRRRRFWRHHRRRERG